MNTSSAITLADARAILDEAPFTQWPGTILHGPSFELVADVAMWLAIMTMTGREDMAVTIEMKTSFLRPTRNRIVSRAEVLRLGRRIASGVAVTTDAEQRIVAHSTLTYARADTK